MIWGFCFTRPLIYNEGAGGARVVEAIINIIACLCHPMLVESDYELLVR